MLKRLNKYVAEALHFAEEAEHRAADATDPATQASHAKVARGWRLLAQSFDLTERLQHFLLWHRRARKPDASVGPGLLDLPTHFPTAPAVLDGNALAPTMGEALDATYRVWQRESEWLWEVSSALGHNLGFGRAASSAQARAAAFKFWLDCK